MNPLVYIASPLSGDVARNLDFARQACRYAIAEGVTPFAPHLLYPQILDDSDPAQRRQGIDMGSQMLRLCDELWLCGDRISPGMAGEKTLAESLGLPVRHISAEEIMLVQNQKESRTMTEGKKYSPPAVYAIWAEAAPDGPMSGRSGFLSETGKRLFFHTREETEVKIRDLENLRLNKHPAMTYRCLEYPGIQDPSLEVCVEEIKAHDLRPEFEPLRYEITDRSYGNTGGGCMVGVLTVRLPELDKTVWVNCGDEGVAVTSADYIWNEDHSESWKRYEDVAMLEVNFQDTHPEGAGALRPIVQEAIAYTISQKIASGCLFQLPAQWLPEEYRQRMDPQALALALKEGREVTIGQDGVLLADETSMGANHTPEKDLVMG